MGKLIYEPYPKQRQFLACVDDEALFGGARGGGKTLTLIVDSAAKVRKGHWRDVGGIRKYEIDKVSVDYVDYQALILRKNYSDLKINFLPQSNKIYKAMGARWYANDQKYVFPSGATIYLAHFENDNAIEKYIGGNYHYLGIEEANQFGDEEMIKLLKGSVRSVNPELRPYVRYTSNPGGAGHLWLKKLFIDRCPPVIMGEHYNAEFEVSYRIQEAGSRYVDESGLSYWYIPCGVFDNPKLLENDPGYIKKLKSLDPVRRKMWLDGDWDAMGGVFFEEWNHLHHVVNDFTLDKDYWKIYRAIDYGSTNPFACLFIAVDPFGYVVVFDEIYERNCVPSRQAYLIRERSEKWGLDENDIFLTVLDPAMRQKNTEYGGTFRSVADIYTENGIRSIYLGDNSRVPGWVMFKDYLHVPDITEERDIPYLRFSSICKNCIRTIPTLVQSRSNPDDVNTDGEDHCADALRYALMYLRAPHKKEPPPDSKPKWFRDLTRDSDGGAKYDTALINVI